jgi:hypothetical protein
MYPPVSAASSVAMRLVCCQTTIAFSGSVSAGASTIVRSSYGMLIDHFQAVEEGEVL